MSKIIQMMMVAAIAILGIAWMSDTYFKFAMPTFKVGIIDMVQALVGVVSACIIAVSLSELIH